MATISHNVKDIIVVDETEQQKTSLHRNRDGRELLQFLDEANRSGGTRVIADNKLVYEKWNDWTNKPDSTIGIWTSTIVINEGVDKPFKDVVEYKGVTFNVPEEYQGLKNKALVLDSKTVSVEEVDENLIVTGCVLKCIDYPNKDGWYETDKDTEIPVDKKSSCKNPGARYLFRSDGARIAPAIRGFFDEIKDDHGRRLLDVEDPDTFSPIDDFGWKGVDLEGSIDAEFGIITIEQKGNYQTPIEKLCRGLTA